MALWNYISEIGVSPDYEDKLIKKIRIANQINLISCCIFWLTCVNNFMLKDYYSVSVLMGFGVAPIISFILNAKEKHSISISFTLVIIGIAIFYFDSYSGRASGTFLYYFPLFLAIAFAFDYHE